MKYSIIYGHLERVDVKKGQKLKYGDKLGIMGTTGNSTGIHLHISVVEGVKSTSWSLSSMKSYNIPSQSECLYFMNNNLFGSKKYGISNGWLGYSNHYGYDLVSKDNTNEGKTVYWNIKEEGTVMDVGSQLSKEDGWGNYIVVTYERKLELKYKLNDEVIFTGNLYRDSYGNGKGIYYDNFKCKITLINNNISSIKPYNINNGLGWVSEDDLTLYIKPKEEQIDKPKEDTVEKPINKPVDNVKEEQKEEVVEVPKKESLFTKIINFLMNNNTLSKIIDILKKVISLIIRKK